MKDWPPLGLMGILSTVSSEARRSINSEVLIDIEEYVQFLDAAIVQIQNDVRTQLGAPDWSIENE